MTLPSFWSLSLGPFVAAAILAGGLAPLIIGWYKKNKWLDDPKTHKHVKVVHTYPVPRGGGLVIWGALVIGTLIFLGLDKYTLGILGGATVIAITGWWDDIKDTNPYMRLLLGLLAAGLVVMAGIGIAYITNPFGVGVIKLNSPQIPFYLAGQLHTLWIAADILAVIWIVWCMNMINWSKGLDGQLPGIIVIAAIIIGILSFKFADDVTQWPVMILAAITAGAYLGFLPWNFYPQKMMPGYGGGALAGYLLAVLSILSGAKLATLMLVLAIPMIDAIYVILNRIRHKKSPVWGDDTHFHHKLMALGWGKRRIAIFYWLITLILGLIALRLNAREKAFTIALLILVFGVVLVWVNYFTSSLKRPGQDNG